MKIVTIKIFLKTVEYNDKNCVLKIYFFLQFRKGLNVEHKYV